MMTEEQLAKLRTLMQAYKVTNEAYREATEQNQRWWAEYRDAHNNLKLAEVLLSTDDTALPAFRAALERRMRFDANHAPYEQPAVNAAVDRSKLLRELHAHVNEIVGLEAIE